MDENPTGGGEKDVPIPPPRHLFAASAAGGLVGAAVGAMLTIWIIGCCCDDDTSDTRTSQSQVESVVGIAEDAGLRLG